MSAGIIQIEPLAASPSHAPRPSHSTSFPSYPSPAEGPSHSHEVSRSASNTSLPGVPPSRELGRSASYTSLPGVVDNSSGIKRTFSDNVLSSLAQQPPIKVDSSIQNANVELFRRASQKTKRRMSAARFVSANEVEESERAGRWADKSDAASIRSLSRGAAALKKLSRRSWMPSSRPSPPPKQDTEAAKGLRAEPERSENGSTRNIALPEPAAMRVSSRTSRVPDESTGFFTTKDDPVSRQDSSSPSNRSRTASEYSLEFGSERSSKRLSRRSSISSVRSRVSIDKMFLSVPSSKVPPLPSSISPDRLSGHGPNGTRKRDPQWTLFRNIDGEHASFYAKTGLQKAKVVRTILLPFLSKTFDPAIIHSLRAEDLDRRAVILNKWWTGLLDLLNGTGLQSISGTDRPAFFEAICEIMMRAEWKTPPSQASNQEASDAQEQFGKTDSDSSIDSEEPDFLVRSVQHNIRNMFAQNLIQQMTFIVDKLSMRAAPASLVLFGGKTCAYAFFYCAGVADMLTRLWRIPPGTMRRIFAEYGPGSEKKASTVSRTLAPQFPPALRSLCFTSSAGLSRQLQSKAQVPPNTTLIRWHGPWVNRWVGRDSDLFFVFVKHYHLLVAEHLPGSLLPDERMGIPGMIAVHAQVLLNLESALYRQPGHHGTEQYTSPNNNPDAVAPQPMIIANATRSIGENRLVMLLRDSIGDRRADGLGLTNLLVGAFQYILKAAVRKVSMYNHDACFVLCDFLEELVPLVSRYQQTNSEDEDWSFWFKVYQQLMQTQATMTQIRVIAFLYSTWPILIHNDHRKRQVVLDWILEPHLFSRYFNHWSPMVRHYFLRLLCWRVARSDGAPSAVDLEIYQRFSQLLKKSWAHHQYLIADAEMRGSSPPSIHPCAPAPGRALLIIRTDNKGSNSFTSFDKLLPSSTNQSTPYNSHSSMLNKVPEADLQQASSKKRWGLLKSIGLFSGPTNARPGEVTPPSSPDSMKASKTGKGGRGASHSPSRASTPPHQPLYFKFTLEFTSNRPQLPSKGRKLLPPTLPHTSQKLLDDLDKVEQLGSREKLLFREPEPLKPLQEELSTARYSGRALSEWAQVVQECRSFYLRRKQEGCPKDSAVETPSIAVESFRMFG